MSYHEVQAKVVARVMSIIGLVTYLTHDHVEYDEVKDTIWTHDGLYRRVTFHIPARRLDIDLEFYDLARTYEMPSAWITFRHDGIPSLFTDEDGCEHWAWTESWPLDGDGEFDFELELSKWNPREVWDRYIQDKIEPMSFVTTYDLTYLPAGRMRQIKVALVTSDEMIYNGRTYCIDRATNEISSSVIEDKDDDEDFLW